MYLIAGSERMTQKLVQNKTKDLMENTIAIERSQKLLSKICAIEFNRLTILSTVSTK